MMTGKSSLQKGVKTRRKLIEHLIVKSIDILFITV